MNISRKLKGLFAVVAAAVGMTAVAAPPSVTINEVKSVKPWVSEKGEITVDYSLANVDTEGWYKVAFDVTAKNETKGVTNDAAKLVDGTYTNTIETTMLFGRETVAKDAKVKVTLIAVPEPTTTVPTDADGFDYTTDGVTFVPGDYIVVDLATGTETEMKGVTSAATFNTDEYKTTKMAFRYVPAGKFKANCATEKGYSTLTANDVELSAYWIAVFPVTEAQYNLVKDGSVGSGTTKPKASITWNSFRGGTWNGTSGEPGSGTFVKALCDKSVTGKFDLCTSFQWERAARAGTRTDYFFCETTAATADKTDFKALYDYAWFGKNNSPSGNKAVGEKESNAWGLYDVYGNVFEWCLDWHATLSGVTVGKDYGGAASGEDRVTRGGDYNNYAGVCSSVSRYSYPVSTSNADHYGFRLVRKPAAE